jgi:hypothetical protein
MENVVIPAKADCVCRMRLIEEHNPYWHDLYPEIMDNAPEQVTGFPPARE